MVPFDAEGYKKFMSTTVADWLKTTVKGGQFAGCDGKRIQYYKAINPNAKAVIVMVHGFCEFFGKFHEMAYDFWESGYSVFFIEQRGHGLSYRPVKELDHVDVSDFSEYVEDLRCLLDRVVKPETKDLPLYLYAHSMGGCVSCLFLERHPEYFSAAILSSPMLKMTFGTIPLWQVRLLIVGSKVLKWDTKTMPGQNDFDGTPDFENSASTSRARFDYQFNLRVDPASNGMFTMNAGTYRWGRAAWKATHELIEDEKNIQIPVLVCQAGIDYFVDNEGQDHFVKSAPNAKLIRFPEAKHEIFNSDDAVMEKYVTSVIEFYDSIQG